MNKYYKYLLVILVAASVIAVQWFMVMAQDDFTVITGNHKVFVYGFPFRVIKCNANLPLHMTTAEIAMRISANFIVFVFVGLLFLSVRRYWQKRLHKPA